MFKKLMFIAALVFISILTGCASVPMASKEQDSAAKSFTKPSADKAALYVYRNSFVGQALTKAIYIDGFFLGETANKTFFYKEIQPGKHQLSTESEFSNNDVSFQAEGGNNYFAEQIIKMGVFVGGAALQMVTEEEGMREVLKCDLASVAQTQVSSTGSNPIIVEKNQSSPISIKNSKVDMAQEIVAPKRNTVFLGLALPQGDFASTVSSVQKAGFAKTGFCGGVEIGNAFNNDVISGITTISLSLNAMDETALSQLASQSSGYSASVTAGSYITLLSMYGVKFETPISPDVLLYGQVQVGALFSKMPDWTVKVTSYYGSGSTTTTSDLAATFAYGVGGGIKLNDKFNFGFRYFAGSPEYTQKIGTTTMKMPLSTSIIQLVVGMMF